MIGNKGIRPLKSLLISVAVCTRNRGNMLRGLLEDLASQDIDPSDYEILIVDNNSSDETQSIARAFHPENVNARYFHEPFIGLSNARNRGWKEARGNYVAYVDDDCRIPGEWLKNAKDIIERHSPHVFGGPYHAYFNSRRPKWFRYGDHWPWDEERFLEIPEFGGLTGGNIFILRTLLETLGGFDPNLGMKGNNLAYGEETELLKRISALKPTPLLYYDPKLTVKHLVAPEKMSMNWIIRQRFIGGRYSLIAIKNGLNISKAKLPLMVLFRIAMFAAELFKCATVRNRSQYPYFQNYLYEVAFENIRYLGQLYEEYLRMRRCDASP
jgi:glycosyltransferase involved in cell wall biosynthesis